MEENKLALKMTVTVPAKNDMATTDDNDNETCCTDKHCSRRDHTESLLDDCLPTETFIVNKSNTKNVHKNKDEICENKLRRLLTFEEAPAFLKHNYFILTGYRGILNTKLCLESIFWWTNESINIWSHIFGFALFLALTLYDFSALKIYASFGDKFIVAIILFCFQACMFLSALYHTFSCRSEEDSVHFLTLDLFGIALSLFSIYMSGIYYAFWCDQDLQYFYVITVTIIFIIAMTLQIPRFKINEHLKMFVFVAWAIYGVIPTFHWTIRLGGLENPLVKLLLPRVLGMYVISGTAFLIYLTKVPERFFAGKFDFVGHSHQWWHIIIVYALFYWHNTGMMYVEYRMNHACSDKMRLP